MNPLGAYNGRRIEIMVKGGVDIANFDWFSIYCVSVGENFSQLPIPQNISVPPVLSDIRRKLDRPKLTAFYCIGALPFYL